MSLIYSKLTNIINRTSDEIHKSFLFTFIFSVIGFIENLWINSYFKRFYPNRDFLGFLNKSYILKEHIFNPLIVLVVFSIFLALSLTQVSLSLSQTLAVAFISFFAGSFIIPRFIPIKKNVLDFKPRDVYSLGFCLMLIAIIFFFISIASVGGVPLLKPSIRYLLKPAFTMPVFLIIPGSCILASVYLNDFTEKKITYSQVRFRFILLLAIDTLFLLSLGYRTPLLAALLMLIIIAYFGNIVSVWEVVLAVLIGVGAIVGIGYFRSLGELAITSVDPFYTLKSRADFTLHVLEHLNFLGGMWGATHGQMLAGSIPGSELGPRMMVGRLIAWRSEVTVTPTLIGQMVADFGVAGVAFEMLVLGIILGVGFKICRINRNYFFIGLYSLLLTYAILGVETGILDIHVLFYFALAVFIYTAYIFKSIKKV